MYSSAYSKIFWGIMLIIFNINIGVFDILPNVVGFILIYFALTSLELQHETYKKGKLPAVILGVLSLKDLIKIGESTSLSAQLGNIGTLIFTGISAVIHVYLIYIICRGIYELSIERNLEELANRTRKGWKFFFVAYMVFLIFTPFTMNLSSDYDMLVIIIGIFTFISSLFIAAIVKNSETELGE